MDHREAALAHAEQAARLLHGVDSRTDEGPVYGAVKAASAQAHATLAQFHADAFKWEAGA